MLAGLLAALIAAVLASGLAVPASGQATPPHLDPAFIEAIDDALVTGTVTPPGAELLEKQKELAAYDDLVYGYPDLTEDELTSRYFKDGRFREVSDSSREYRPRADVRIVRDAAWGVPHIYGDTDLAAAFGAGYAAAEDRLVIMELLRALGRAEAFELLETGAAWLADAEIVRLYGYTEDEWQAMIDRMPAEYGQDGQDLVDLLEQMTAGINHFILQFQQGLIPVPLSIADLGIQQSIAPWSPRDIVAVVSIVRALFGAGGGTELANAARFASLSDTYGVEDAVTVYEDFRQRHNLDGPLHTLDAFPYMPVPEGDAQTFAGNVFGFSPGDTGVEGLLDQITGLFPGGTAQASSQLADLAERSRIRWDRIVLDTKAGRIDLSRAEDAAMSNYLVAGGSRTASGHPILLGGPQAGYFDPQILVENELHGDRLHARGAGFPGMGLVVIGRSHEAAWTATAGGGDMIDTYIEVLCDPDGGEADEQEVHYLFNGECVPMDRRVHRQAPAPLPGEEALPDIIVERTVHGPVVARGRIGDLAVAVSRKRSTYLKELDAGVSILKLNRGEVPTAQDFVELFRRSHNLSTNWAYINADEIGYSHGGLYPIRPTDVHPDFPVWGTGEWEWQTDADGDDVFLGLEEVPYAVNPERDYLVSWNNRQAPGWSPSDANWGYGALYRASMLEDKLRAEPPASLTPVRMVQIMEEAGLTDLRGSHVYPLALEVMKGLPAPSPREARMVDLLEEWIDAQALRRDGDRDGEYDHAAAVAIADAWWDRMIHGIYDPALGRSVDTVSRQGFHNAPGSGGSAFQGGFYGQVWTDLAMVLGREVKSPTSQTYCGSPGIGTDGSPTACAGVLWAALVAAGDTLGGDDPDAWAADAQSERILFLPTVALSMHWVNRPTTQVLAMFGRGAVAPPPAPEPTSPLPATGSGLVLGGTALVMAAVAGRRSGRQRLPRSAGPFR